MLSTFQIISFFIGANISFATINEANLIATELPGQPTDRSITVNAIADTDLKVFFEYGIEPNVPTYQTDATIFTARNPIKVVIDQLQRDTRYSYPMRYRRLGEVAFVSRSEHSFHTQKARGSTFKFAIRADSHLYDKKCYPDLYQRTLQNILADNPDFLLDLGDTFGDNHDISISYEELVQADARRESG